MHFRQRRQCGHAGLFLLGLLWCLSAPAAQSLKLTSNQFSLPPGLGDELESVTPAQITPWVQINVEPGDTLSALFQQAGLAADEWSDLPAPGKQVDPLRRLRPGDYFELRKTPDSQLAALRFPLNPVDTLVVTRTQAGLRSKIAHLNSQTRRLHASGRVGQSLPASLREAGIPGKIATALSNIYRWRTNLSHSMRPGDSFSVIYSAEFVDGERVATGPIIAASVQTRDGSHKAFLHADDDGQPRYYDPQGQPYRPAIRRTPVEYDHVSSPFDSSRVHPVLHVRRPHNGVDLAAERGTPVHAAADGEVTFVGSMRGYGRLVKIDHAMRYSTRYGHMSGFAPGLDAGDTVEQGQVIGYVGSTGTATGMHLHYEIRHEGIAHNPLIMKLPGGKPLPGSKLAAFSSRIQPLIAQLDGNTGMPSHTLIAAATGLGAYRTCAEAATINAALALAPARAANERTLGQIFCISPGPTSA